MDELKSVASGAVANFVSVIIPYFLYKFCKRLSKSHCTVHDNKLDFSLPTERSENIDGGPPTMAEIAEMLSGVQSKLKNIANDKLKNGEETAALEIV